MMELLMVLPALLTSLGKTTIKQSKAFYYVWFYGLLYGYSISNIQWMCKQVILETGWGGSRLLESNNNAFGMSCSNNPANLQIGCEQLSDGNTNAKFKSIKTSVKDRFLWDRKRFTVPYAHRKLSSYAQEVSDRYIPSSSTSYYQSVTNLNVNSGYIFLTYCIFIPVEILLIIKLIK
jgi:hypothetical protein